MPRLRDPAFFDRSPLETEGPVVIYRFDADLAGTGSVDYFVVVGQTEPNYYPAGGLEAGDAFVLHLGTRFMLVMGIGLAGDDRLKDYDVAADIRQIVDRVAPREAIEDVEIATAFAVSGDLHIVVRCRLAGESVFVFAGDCPPGFDRRTDLAPQVAYRLHLGRLLLNEQGHEPDVVQKKTGRRGRPGDCMS